MPGFSRTWMNCMLAKPLYISSSEVNIDPDKLRLLTG